MGLNFIFSFDFRTRGLVLHVGSNRDQRDDVDRVDTRSTRSDNQARDQLIHLSELIVAVDRPSYNGSDCMRSVDSSSTSRVLDQNPTNDRRSKPSSLCDEIKS